MRKIYCCELSQEELDAYPGIQDPNTGKNYEFQINILDGYIQVVDGCGRLLPVDISHINKLVNGLVFSHALLVSDPENLSMSIVV